MGRIFPGHEGVSGSRWWSSYTPLLLRNLSASSWASVKPEERRIDVANAVPCEGDEEPDAQASMCERARKGSL